ncbi:MAG: hypothetical protein AAF367_08010 [Pseudomonadota bacterium]
MADYPEKGATRPDPMAFGRGLSAGLGINLLVSDVDRAGRFGVEVLGATIVYWEEHFAIMSALGSIWQLHSDWTYRDHELRGAVEGVEVRGSGAELRLYGADPDAAVRRARAWGADVLSAALDKPHGLREAHIIDPDGYIWVPSVALPKD